MTTAFRTVPRDLSKPGRLAVVCVGKLYRAHPHAEAHNR
jgi:hypothetical protein